MKLLHDLVQKHKSFAISAREHIHAHPELSDQEFETIRYICERLDEIGVPYQKLDGMNAIVGFIQGGVPGKTIALRADIDALPIQETSDKPYRSQHPGVMHACGHDAHAAVLLGTAKVLWDLKDKLCGNVKLFFQPAEEADGGAKRMLAAGCLENPHVDYVFGLHVNGQTPCGTIRGKVGAINAAGDNLDVTIHGKKAHGAYPSAGADAIVAAAYIITALQTVVSRLVSPIDSAVVTVGVIKGGDASNVICNEVKFTIMLRTLKPETREKVIEAIRRLVNDTCSAHGVTAEIVEIRGYDAMINNAECVEIVRDTAEKVLGKDAFSYVEHASLGCEDFCYFCQDRPGAFYQLGCGNAEFTAPGHNDKFDLDPETMGYGMLMQAGIVLKLIGSDEVKIL
jgi:amidohydrolase